MNIKNKQFKTFDPNPSLKYALQLLNEANISKFSLIGKLAMWVHLEDESQHQYTKDVDFAILLNDISKLEEVVSKKCKSFRYLQIGGIGIREEGISIDFIDRRLHGVQYLFSDAIANSSVKVTVDQYNIPVVSPEYLIAMKIVSGEPKDDNDLKMLLTLKNFSYEKTRAIVKKHLGPITAERLDVFARDAGILPKRGPYKYSG
ncbi:nucleotidyl transferase AbiEii/AbiGii toxin family protein [Desulfococcaceae bacterium HSG8]|nr:nucleotidyl transferase AbiEii/AbiGii toxin family protein [Desulfococcaceae bacterium HSG8]